MVKGYTVDVLTNVACAGGTTVAADIDIVTGNYAQDLVYNDALTLTVPRRESWLADIEPRHVFHVTDPIGRVTEWRYVGQQYTRAAGMGATATLVGRPVIWDLTTCGPIFTLGAGRRRFNLGDGGLNITSAHYWDTFIGPFLTARGITWIVRGTFEITDRFSVNWDRWTPKALLDYCAEQVAGELEFERNGSTNYRMHLRALRGSTLVGIDVRTDKQIIRLADEKRAQDLKTIVIATGQVPEGEADGDDIGFAAWKVTSVTVNSPTSGKTTIGIVDPAGVVDPARFDDEYGGSGLADVPNRYALLPTATLVEIIDTVKGATTTLILNSNTTALVVGDYIEIRADSSGNMMSELANPAAVALYGPTIGHVSNPDLRGERNMLTNGVPFDWPTPPPFPMYGNIAASGSGVTSVQLKNLTPGVVIANTDFLCIANITTLVPITTGGTVAGGGTVTVSVTTTNVTLNDKCVVLRPTPATGWTLPANPMNSQPGSRYVSPCNRSISGTLTASAQGLQNTAGIFLWNLFDGLTPGDIINPGDLISATADPMSAGSLAVWIVICGNVVDGTGAIKLLSQNAGASTAFGMALNDNDVRYITRRWHGSEGAPQSIALPSKEMSRITSPAWKVWATATSPRLWGGISFTLNYQTHTTAGNTLAGGNLPTLEIINADTSAVLGTVQLNDGANYTVIGTEEFFLKVAYTITATTNIALRLTTIGQTEVMWAMLWFAGGVDDIHPIRGSYANKIVELAHNTLEDTSIVTRALTVTMEELERNNPTLTAEALGIGQTVYLYSDYMPGDEELVITARVAGMRIAMGDGAPAEVTFDTISPRMTRTLARQRSDADAKIFVQINVQDIINVIETATGVEVDPTTVTENKITYVTPTSPPAYIGSYRPNTDDPYTQDALLNDDGPLVLGKFVKQIGELA